jgi:hypothetical protein
LLFDHWFFLLGHRFRLRLWHHDLGLSLLFLRRDWDDFIVEQVVCASGLRKLVHRCDWIELGRAF